MKNRQTIISASVSGKGHLDSGIPCQDSNNWEKLGKGWTILVTSDGAGSQENSHYGSSFVVKDIANVLKCDVAEKLWFSRLQSPSAAEWREFIIICLRKTYENLKQYAKYNNFEFRTLACTISLALTKKDVVLTAHIGDGRACYQNQQEEWFSMMQPFKGEEAGSTVFITTDWCWELPKECIETRIIESDIKTIVLLTDGMEAYSFLCYVKNENEMYSDPNLPYVPFLDSNIRAIDSMINSGLNINKITKMWKEYLSSGKGMENEYDDKTMLIAIYH